MAAFRLTLTLQQKQHFPFSLSDTPHGPAAAVVAGASDDFRHSLAQLYGHSIPCHAVAANHISQQSNDNANTTNSMAWCYTMDIPTSHAATQLCRLSTQQLLLCECSLNLTEIWLKLVLWVKHLH